MSNTNQKPDFSKMSVRELADWLQMKCPKNPAVFAEAMGELLKMVAEPVEVLDALAGAHSRMFENLLKSVRLERDDREEGNEFGRREAAQERAAFASDPDFQD